MKTITSRQNALFKRVRDATREPAEEIVIEGPKAVADALGAATKVIYPQAGYHTENLVPDAAPVHKNVKVIALADVFPDRLNSCREQLGKLEISIPKEMCFSGFDAYKQLLAVPEVNYVILATPPHFRALHLKAAIDAGKNVFMEKPLNRFMGAGGTGIRMADFDADVFDHSKVGFIRGGVIVVPKDGVIKPGTTI